VLKCPHYLPLERRPSTVCLCAIKQPFLIFIASDSGLHRHEQPKRRKSLILYLVLRTLTKSSTFAAPEHMYSMTQQAENSHQIASFGSVARPNSFLLFVPILLVSYLLDPFIKLSDRCAATCGTGQGFSGHASIGLPPTLQERWGRYRRSETRLEGDGDCRYSHARLESQQWFVLPFGKAQSDLPNFETVYERSRWRRRHWPFP